MSRFSALFILFTPAIMLVSPSSSLSDAVADDRVENARVSRVYVIRRKIGGGESPPINRGAAAHSALLLQLEDSRLFYVLEYMDDSKVHLILTDQEILHEYEKEGYIHIKAMGWSDGRKQIFHWTRQFSGKPLDGNWTPEKLKKEMEQLVADYSVWKAEHCHSAQERLRKSLGIF